jgi:hypothetical protein
MISQMPRKRYATRALWRMGFRGCLPTVNASGCLAEAPSGTVTDSRHSAQAHHQPSFEGWRVRFRIHLPPPRHGDRRSLMLIDGRRGQRTSSAALHRPNYSTIVKRVPIHCHTAALNASPRRLLQTTSLLRHNQTYETIGRTLKSGGYRRPDKRYCFP